MKEIDNSNFQDNLEEYYKIVESEPLKESDLDAFKEENNEDS